ncbi:MAG TPA: zeta toxin family protein [Pyrinomonadaceae bacterium]|nr:zeta toxin family protein [Pyrinomonadaceae bacterium]
MARVLLSLVAADFSRRLLSSRAVGESALPKDLNEIRRLFLTIGQDEQRNIYPGRLRVEKARGLSDEERRVEASFAALLTWGLMAYVKEYCRRWNNVLNTDNAREFSEDYNHDKESRARYARAVHEPAGALIKTIWNEMVRMPNRSEHNFVMFLAGGAGSGKTTAVEDLPDLSQFRSAAQIIYDTTMSGLSSSTRKVEEARAHGKSVLLLYVHRPYEKATRGMIERALREGRTVPARVLAEDHFNAQRTFLSLHEKYADDDDFVFLVVDNSGERGQAAIEEVDFLSSVLYNNLGEVIRNVENIVKSEYRERAGTGREIPLYVYRAILGEDV